MNPIANQLDVPQFRRFCRALIEDYVDLFRDAGPQGGEPLHRGGGGQSQLRRYYYEQRLHGRGVFIEELPAELERRGVAFAAADEVDKKEGTGGDS